MATIVKEWSEGSVSIAVEVGKNDANKEGPHVHIYKGGRRTDAFISLNRESDKGIDMGDFRTACKLFDRYLSDVKNYHEKVRTGEYDD